MSTEQPVRITGYYIRHGRKTALVKMCGPELLSVEMDEPVLWMNPEAELLECETLLTQREHDGMFGLEKESE